MQKRIASEFLRPGLRLPGPLLDEWGCVLIEAGACLTVDDFARIGRHAPGGLYGTGDWPDHFLLQCDEEPTLHDATGEAISVESLRSGMRVPHDIYDPDTDVLLLAAGVHVTPRFLHLLRARGIKTVRPKPPQRTSDPPDPLQNAQTRWLDALLEDELRKKIPFRPLSRAERPRLALADLKGEAMRGLEQHAAASNLVAGICDTLSRGRDAPGSEIHKAISIFVTQATLDVDLLPLIVSLQQSRDEYLYDHCLNVALLSMSIAAQAGLERNQITEIGFGALLQDIGMLRVPQELRFARRTLTPEERFEIKRHPILTLDWLEQIDGVPLIARFIGYQSHERVDAQGYPGRRAGSFVHQYAKLVGIADSFAAMTRPRPYRNAFLPYEAGKLILADAHKFDRAAVRMFLDTIGLFPIGSFVELNGGITGQVLRANPGAHTRPVVEPLDADGKPTGRLVNLWQETDFKVVRAVR